MSSNSAVNGPSSSELRAPIASSRQKRSLLDGPGDTRRHPPVLAKGFRLFFLLAGAWAVLMLPAWLATLDGAVAPRGPFDPMTWHAHEMLFGFTTAVIAGFLLTAVGNWTGRETLVGAPLAAAGALWVAGRVVVTLPSSLPPWVAAIVELSFLPVLAAAIARPLVATKNRRNFVMVAMLGVLWAADLAMHLDALGVAPGLRARAVTLAVDVVVLMMLVMAGRVFPMFTRNGTGVTSVVGHPALDRAAIAAMVATTALDLAVPDRRLGGVMAAVTAALVVARTVSWGARHTLRVPLLWILHVGHAWIAVGLALRAVASLAGVVSPVVATHALTVGAIGCLTLGMMSRVSLGHTGRPLVATPAMSLSFALLSAAALVRVVTPLIAESAYRGSLLVAGALWTAAFLLFVAGVGPVVLAPRVDHKPG